MVEVEQEVILHNQEDQVGVQEIITMDQGHFQEEQVFVVKVMQEDVLLQMELQVYQEELLVLEGVEPLL